MAPESSDTENSGALAPGRLSLAWLVEFNGLLFCLSDLSVSRSMLHQSTNCNRRPDECLADWRGRPRARARLGVERKPSLDQALLRARESRDCRSRRMYPDRSFRS